MTVSNVVTWLRLETEATWLVSGNDLPRLMYKRRLWNLRNILYLRNVTKKQTHVNDWSHRDSNLCLLQDIPVFDQSDDPTTS